MYNFIVFSGIDGAGKSTQIDLLKDYYIKCGKNVEVIWSRGGYTPGFEKIKNMLRLSRQTAKKPNEQIENRKNNFRKPIVRKIWLLLAILDLIILYGVIIRWKTYRGKVIIADRYLADTKIDFELNFPNNQVSSTLLWKILEKTAVKSNYKFLLIIPVDESLRRSKLKNEPFPDNKETLIKRLLHYNSLTKENYISIDCMQSIEDIHELIINNFKIEA
ncbi:MAG: hypothetical protein R2774_00530 [Saprospiraceae bacterium]